MTSARHIFRTLAFLIGLVIQVVGMAFTLIGWFLVHFGMVIRVGGAIIGGAFVATRGALRYFR